MDVLWFRLPREPGDPAGALGRIHDGHLVGLLDRRDQWQVAYVIPKGSYRQLHAAGIAALRRTVAEAAPSVVANRVGALADWRQVSLLSVASDRLVRWYRPGLLLLGDAAHTMSPVGGVGINYAIMDAVEAANLLHRPLRAGNVALGDLERVQRRREWPTRIMQSLQTQAQRRILMGVLQSRGTRHLPRWIPVALRLPGIRSLGPWFIGFGIRPAHVAPALRLASVPSGVPGSLETPPSTS
jgi:2-polyprenyl-6-methoxyphenol hydroxylase-like FAD-dependent oxidoreductase